MLELIILGGLFRCLREKKSPRCSIYTPGIYVEGYIVFCLFICEFVHLFVPITFVELLTTFWLNYFKLVYIPVTTYQKSFIYRP